MAPRVSAPSSSAVAGLGNSHDLGDLLVASVERSDRVSAVSSGLGPCDLPL